MINNEIITRTIKIIDIVYITLLFFILTISVSKGLDHLIGNFDKEKSDSKHLIVIFLEIIGNISLIAILAYVIRNLIQTIPFPLDGLYGYEHKRIKELQGGVILGFLLFFYQENLKRKINYFFERLGKYI